MLYDILYTISNKAFTAEQFTISRLKGKKVLSGEKIGCQVLLFQTFQSVERKKENVRKL